MRKVGQQGFTLADLLVSMGVMGLVVTLVGNGIFQGINLSDKVSDGFLAQSDTRTPVFWLARDIAMAYSTTLVDGAAPVTSATFTWTDYFGDASTAHSLSYALVGTELQRTYDGVVGKIGRRVSAVTFSRSGRVVTAVITSSQEGRFQISDSKTVNIQMRTDG